MFQRHGNRRMPKVKITECQTSVPMRSWFDRWKSKRSLSTCRMGCQRAAYEMTPNSSLSFAVYMFWLHFCMFYFTSTSFIIFHFLLLSSSFVFLSSSFHLFILDPSSIFTIALHSDTEAVSCSGQRCWGWPAWLCGWDEAARLCKPGSATWRNEEISLDFCQRKQSSWLTWSWHHAAGATLGQSDVHSIPNTWATLKPLLSSRHAAALGILKWKGGSGQWQIKVLEKSLKDSGK